MENGKDKFLGYDKKQLEFLIANATQELEMRRKVYPGMVHRGRMTKKQMENKIMLQQHNVLLLEAAYKQLTETLYGVQSEMFQDA